MCITRSCGEGERNGDGVDLEGLGAKIRQAPDGRLSAGAAALCWRAGRYYPISPSTPLGQPFGSRPCKNHQQPRIKFRGEFCLFLGPSYSLFLSVS